MGFMLSNGFMGFIETVSRHLNELSIFNFSYGLSPGLYFVMGSALIVLLAFCVALIFKAGSKAKKATKNIKAVTEYCNSQQIIDAGNIDKLHEQIEKLPDPAVDGFSKFLDNPVAYPSEFMPESEMVNCDRAMPKFKAGKSFFFICSWLFVAISAILMAISAIPYYTPYYGYASLDLSTVANVVLVAFAAGGAPLILLIVLGAILSAGYRKQYKKLVERYNEMRYALDEKVVLYQYEQVEDYVAENIEEINYAIEQILMGRVKRDSLPLDVQRGIEAEDRYYDEAAAAAAEAEALDYSPEEFPEEYIYDPAHFDPTGEQEKIDYTEEPILITDEEPVIEEEPVIDREKELIYLAREQELKQKEEELERERAENQRLQEEIERLKNQEPEVIETVETVVETIIETEPNEELEQENQRLKDELEEMKGLFEQILAAQAAAVEPEPEYPEDDGKALEDMTEEERIGTLIGLVELMDALVNDRRTRLRDIEECVELLAGAQESGYFESEELAEIIEDCFTILAAAYYRKPPMKP